TATAIAGNRATFRQGVVYPVEPWGLSRDFSRNFRGNFCRGFATPKIAYLTFFHNSVIVIPVYDSMLEESGRLTLFLYPRRGGRKNGWEWRKTGLTV
ncbi:MAG: hypothetical protein LBT33_08945, partial [Spirochaetia bacterium]|nr:hypothetical protein [Spirochaetia bacterium]